MLQVKAQTKFHTNDGIPYIPLLDTVPTVDSAGAVYMNKSDNTIYWYDGNSWIPGCGLYAPDGTKVVELVSTSGRTWMDRNLGASQAADSLTDYNAYGSLFQWCRAADGHQLINWKSSTSGTPVNDTTSTLSTTTSPSHSKFIINSNSPYDWLSTQQSDGSLWWDGSSVGANNPCPTGYHVPTETEWQTEIDLFAATGGENATGAYALLKLPIAGYRTHRYGLLSLTDSDGIYWSSTVNGSDDRSLRFNSSNVHMYSYDRANGFCVRCIKDE